MIRENQWRPSEGLKLEPNALLAVRETQRSLVLTAGPGAGKTEMLAQRADFLLRTGVCQYPQRILAISFKVDASRNLKDRVRQRCGVVFSRRLDSHTFHGFAKRLIDRFRPVLTGTDALDPDYTIGVQRFQRRQIAYDDLVPLATKILQSSSVALNAVRQTYSHVFLDEFQDCTNTQYQLIRTAFLGADVWVTAVGDTKQRIMAWAGALDGIFETFAKDFDALSLNLYQNFRSEPRLRRIQNAMVKVMDVKAALADTDLVGSGGSAAVRTFEDAQTEARSVAEWIQQWIGEEGVPASEIAVLVSKQPELYASHLMAELRSLGVPVRNEQTLQDLSAEPVARLIVDFLSVVIGDREPEAYARLMSVLSDTGDDDASYEVHYRWRYFLEVEHRKVRQSSHKSLVANALRQSAERFLAFVGREAIAALSAEYERGDRLDNIITNTFNHIIELVSIHNNAVQALARFSEGDSVRIMTIHKSKGLEFDTVIVLGVENQTFWGKVVAERSAFFVGISRAKRRLYLTVAARREAPRGHGGLWHEARSPHQEFLGYVTSTV